MKNLKQTVFMTITGLVPGVTILGNSAAVPGKPALLHEEARLEMVELTNALRAEQDLEALTTNVLPMRTAQVRAKVLCPAAPAGGLHRHLGEHPITVTH